MACFLLRRLLAAHPLRRCLPLALAAILSSSLVASDLEIDECCILVENLGCGQSLVRANGEVLDVDGYIDAPEFSRLQVQGSLTGLACDSPCANPTHGCVLIDSLTLCDEGSNFCFGDGTSGWCPCANMAAGDRGCINTSGQGAQFRTGGSPGVGQWIDIYVDGMPAGTPCVLVMGMSAANPWPYHDGILCLGPPYTRLGGFMSNAAGDLELSMQLSLLSSVVPGDTRYYQIWYGDSGFSPCGLGSNFTNAVELNWLWSPSS